MADSYLQWTPPQQGVHPRILGDPSDVSTWQTRIAGTHTGFWSSVLTYANKHLGDDPSGYASKTHTEYTACHAMVYLLTGDTDHADHAIAIAQWYAAQAIPTTAQTRRHYAMAMAIVYDWCYARLTTAARDALRRRIWDYVQVLNINTSEYLWGHSSGNIAMAPGILTAILEDGDAAQNVAWRARMDYYMDHMDDGTDQCFFAGHGHFGDSDGGTYKGAGSHCYFSVMIGWWRFTFPTLSKSLGLDFWAANPWYTQTVWWYLWHWREDRSFHKLECELGPNAHYNIWTQLHSLHIASREDNILGECAQWLINEIADLEDFALWGPYQVHNIIWHNPARTPTHPDVATLGKSKVFANAGHACVRTGWEAGAGTSLAIKFPNYFTAGHQLQRDGSFSMMHNGVLFFRDSGIYSTQGIYTYKVPSDPINTGHRYTYHHRILAASVGRVYDSNEVAENVSESFQRNLGNPNTKIGVKNGSIVVSNDGGQLWPKTATQGSPYHVDDLKTESKWQRDGHLADDDDPDFFSLDTDLTDCYYASKCTKYHRRWLWVEPRVFPDWDFPVVLLWDDLTVHSDAVGKKVYVHQLQSGITPTGTAAELVFTQGTAKLWYKTLKPSSVEYAVTTNFKDLDGNTFPAVRDRAFEDVEQDGSDTKRIEINPTSALTSIEWLSIFFPATTSESSLPSIVLIDTGSYLGATINGIDCKFVRGSPYGAEVGESGDTTPPGAPGQPSCTAGSGFVDVDWADNPEGDLKDYDVHRSKQN